MIKGVIFLISGIRDPRCLFKNSKLQQVASLSRQHLGLLLSPGASARLTPAPTLNLSSPRAALPFPHFSDPYTTAAVLAPRSLGLLPSWPWLALLLLLDLFWSVVPLFAFWSHGFSLLLPPPSLSLPLSSHGLVQFSPHIIYIKPSPPPELGAAMSLFFLIYIAIS